MVLVNAVTSVQNERRYVIKNIDPNIRSETGVKISQGYFDTPPHISLRVRVTGDATAELVRKTGFGLGRSVESHSIDLSAAKFLLESCPDAIEKTRYCRDGFKVDFFHGRLSGLVFAEYEMPNIIYDLPKPAWVYDWLEVTDSMNNRLLARIARDLDDEQSNRPIEDILPKRIPRVVLIGGPGSGKSGMMTILKQEIGDLVHCVPETASIVIGQVGVRPPLGDPVGMRKFQRTLYRVQRSFETVSELQAVRDEKKALLLDRGTVDGAAYMAGEIKEFENVCQTDIKYEYAQYDLVIFLSCPPQFIYEANKANNPACGEDFNGAVYRSIALHRVWNRHFNFYLIESDSWEEKVNKVRMLVSSFLSQH